MTAEEHMDKQCYRFGQIGLCGPTCPALLAGDCPSEEIRQENGMMSFSSWFSPEALSFRRQFDAE